MTALAVLEATAGPDLVLSGLLAFGPCLAAVSGNPRAVLAVGGYALALISALSWLPDKTAGHREHLIPLLATLTVTLVSFALARHLRRLERFADQAQRPLRTLAALVECSDDAIIGKTLDGTIISWNPGAERMYGYSAAEAIGANIEIIAGPAGPIELSDVLVRIAAGERVDHYETQRTHQDGTVVDVSITVSPIVDDRGAVAGASAVARDVGPRKRAEERQQDVDRRAQLDQRMASVGQLAGGIAHDFNNLLAVILNFTAFAAEQLTDDVAVRADLAQVRNAAERAAELTHQLLLFTRGDVNRPELLDVNAAIGEAERMLARTIGEHINLVALPSPDPLIISAEPGKIQQLLVNLAVNARDAMPDGGTLVIEGAIVELDEYEADVPPSLPAGRYVRLVVSDTGTGMSKEVAAHIFEPLYTTKPVGQGTGLGLATAYGIVADAGGNLDVYSELQFGTTFRAYFPVADQASQPPDATPEAIEPPRGLGQTILVVDDDDAVRQVAVRILQAGGYQVTAASGGVEALATDAAHRCDLLLTDAIMPEMSGRRLAEEMRRLRPGLPVVYMSGFSDGLRDTHLIVDQQIGFMEKPFTARCLLQRIHDLLTTAEAAPADISLGPLPGQAQRALTHPHTG
jgi:PAS domain S-box-containing protein